MVLDGIVIGLLLGFLCKGSLKGLYDLHLKKGWVFPVLLFVQLAIYFTQNKWEIIATYSSYTFMIVYIVGMFFLYQNRNNKGFTIILLGVFLNFLVMALNGGRMPVSLEAAAILDPYYAESLKNSLYAKHTIMTEYTKLSFLGDIIPLQPPYPRQQVISIGDIVMNVGIGIFIFNIMVKHKRKNEDTLITN